MSPDTLKNAQSLLESGRVAEALMAAEMSLASRPGDPGFRALRDQALAAVAAMEPGFAALQLDAAVNADKPSAHLELGHAYVLREQWADAERCFRRALALDAGSAEAQASLGLVYLNAGLPEPAEVHSRAALAIDDAHVVASQTLASLLEARGEAEGARTQLRRAYARQALFEQAVADPALRVLVLATESAGNVPYRTIMPPARYTRLVWYMEHARADEAPDGGRYDVVFNTIGDADLAEPSLTAVQRFLAQCGKPVLNLPEPVMRTRRDRIGELLGGLQDVVVPRTVRVSAQAVAARGLRALAEAHGFGGPLLARPAGLHGGRGLVRADRPEALEEVGPSPADHYLIDYVDYRSADGLYRKYRMFFVGGRPFAYHQAISDHWLVHHDTAGMADRPERRTEEARFLESPEAVVGRKAVDAVARIGHALRLDYCGVDFSVLPDGRVLVFEANATMLAHREDPEGPYAYKNPCVDEIAQAFQAWLKARTAEAAR
jgi:Flp pilus assembly protein TadD/glutathione synthase/RimK-type ligase-like ATP-grasp enzyme